MKTVEEPTAFPLSRAVTVFFDGDCGFCGRTVRWLQAADWLRRVRFVPLQSAEARLIGLPESIDFSQMVLLKGKRKWGGWRAFKHLLFHLPLLYLIMACLIVAALAAPGPRFIYAGFVLMLALALSPISNFAGDAFYRTIASHRSCVVGKARVQATSDNGMKHPMTS
ncbi:MAG: DUF393 domain-containing protein [Bryobacterales bacterium]|nr:DUF393 domain-containing protein [Bryobacterales bacterium]